MARQSGVSDRMFRALADEDVNILMITTSEIKISALVSHEQANKSLRIVHDAFQLDHQPSNTTSVIPHASHAPGDASEVIARLQDMQNMEGLTVDDIALDESQARITIPDVPDEPGVAASVFEEIAAADIFVDMIVQSFHRGEKANLSFTVPREHLEKALVVASNIARRLGCRPVTHAPRMAKLSVSGIGMRSHTGVAIGMFEAFAAANINVEMINTSEMRVNAVVGGGDGQKGLEALVAAFADLMD
jgi:aspartate kinase